MARQGYNTNPSMKQMEVFSSFGGGMVTNVHPEKLKDNQMVLMENVDILAGGAVENRGAYAIANEYGASLPGLTQGRFQYINDSGNKVNIVIVNGEVYTVYGNSYTKKGINNFPAGIMQTTRMMEAVQFKDKLYIATGSGLMTYDGTSFEMITAYIPNGMEFLYIGANGYATNPDSAITDSVGVSTQLMAVIPSARYGMMNTPIVFTSYVQKPSADTLEYQYEVKKSTTETYTVERTWSTDKTYTKTFTEVGDYQIRVSVRKSGTTTVLSQYVLPSYKVNSTPEEKPEPVINFDDMKTCNRIFLHYDRLCLYGDTNNPDHLYTSHLNKFTYFPRTNIVKLSDPMRGKLQSVARYRNFLICFTDGSIQKIEGSQPKDYVVEPVHTSLGTKFAYSVQVMKNYVVFVGNDNGVYILKSFQYASSEKLNVERIDGSNQDIIKKELDEAARVLSVIHNNQYYLYIDDNDSRFHIYRFYYEIGIWVRDKIPMQLSTMNIFDGTISATDLASGLIYKLTKSTVLDDKKSQFTMRIITKDYNMSAPHHRKKMKQYQLISKIGFNTTILVKVYADDQLIATQPLIYDYNQDADTQKLNLLTSGRFRTIRTDTTILVKENIQIIGFGFIFKENTPK